MTTAPQGTKSMTDDASNKAVEYLPKYELQMDNGAKVNLDLFLNKI
jgi:hypothetical protein